VERDVQAQTAALDPGATLDQTAPAPGRQTLAAESANVVENPELAEDSLFQGVPWGSASAASESTDGGGGDASHVLAEAHASSTQHHAKPHYAKTDRFNRKQDEHRPHVGHNIKLAADTTRYNIEDGARTRKHDKLAAGTSVTINVAHTRMLRIGGAMEKCVLTRTVDNGAAWTRLEDVASSSKAQHSLGSKVDHRAAHDEAKPPSERLAAKAKPMKFRPGTAPHTGLALTGHVSSQSKSNYDHYLFREKTSKMQEPFHNGYYNICMNLPQHGTPPVQGDVALPGDRFFVITKRQVSLYEKEDPATFKGSDVAEQSRSWWVFGCAAKKEGEHWVPDRARRGWVPARVLEHV
jgi:hypothetical protein